jgi:c(7)-type cytochrome triheme protein
MSLQPADVSRIWLALLVLLAIAIAWPSYPSTPAGPGGGAPPLRLPADITYSHAVGPDSAVHFSHDTHVAFAGNRCLGCHPTPFRMLKPSHRTSHAEMKSGGTCGHCHDGKQAFGIADLSACQTCHTGSRTQALAVADSAANGARPIPQRKSPAAVTFHRGESSPGLVTFRHATHGKDGCASCHPKLFAMKASGGRPGGAMHEAGACGGCHDGSPAFGVEDAEACQRCHVESGGKP